jgi:hypothetical protein
VAIAQPFERSPAQRAAMVACALLAALNLVAPLPFKLLGAEREVLRQGFAASDYAGESLSQPFEVTRVPSVLAITASAPVDNSWLGVNLAVVNDRDEVVGEAEADVSYYHGVDGGESWSEGSRSSRELVRVEVPGRYRLLLTAQGGSAESGPARGEGLDVTVTRNYVPWRYHLLLAVGFLLYPARELLRELRFHAARKREDDDDDDD